MRRWILAVARVLAPAVAGVAHAALPCALAAQEDPIPLQGLIVTASPTPRPASAVARSVTVLEGTELRARGVVRVADALRDVPGVTVVQGGSFGATTSVFMRGGESDYVQVLIDGVQVNQPGGAFDFAGLTLDDVERIEIVRGPASSLFGSDAVAGVIHVITRTGRGPTRLTLSAQGGSYGRREASVSASGGSEAARWSLGASRLRTDGVFPFNNTHENQVLSGNVRLAPDDDTGVGVVLRLADRSYGFPTDGSGAVVDRNARTFGDEASVGLSASRRVAGRLELRSLVTLARTEGGTDDAIDSPADTLGAYGFQALDHVERAAIDLRGNATVGSVVLTAGVELEREKQRSFSSSESEWGPTHGRSAYARRNHAAYLHATGSAGAWSWALGGRLEDNQQYGRFPTWNAGLTWRPQAGTRVRAAAGSAVKEPTFYEAYAEGYVRGNPGLDPERARSWEVGAEQEAVDGHATLRATYFHQRFRDLVQYTAVPASPGAPNYFNLAAADVRGVELGGELRAGALSGGASWTWLDPRVLVGADDEGPGGEFVPGDRLLRRPANTFRAYGALHVARADASVSLRVVGERADRDFTTYPATRRALARATTLDAALEMPLGGGARPAWALRLRGENLLDARYEEVLGYPAPGRGLYVGARVLLGGP